LCTLLERFERRGVALVSVAESLDTGSAAGRLVLNIMTAVSQWEREAIGERTRDAMSHKRTNGERVGNIQFGYRLPNHRSAVSTTFLSSNSTNVGTPVVSPLAECFSNVDCTSVCPLGQCLHRALDEIIIDIATFTDSSGNLVHVFDSHGHMQDAAAQKLQGILGTDAFSGPLVNGGNIGCEGVLASIQYASGLETGAIQRVNPNGLTLLFWNQASPTSTTTFPGNAGYIGWRDARVNGGETFWGLT
jgi:Resolvase, N terminal domain